MGKVIEKADLQQNFEHIQSASLFPKLQSAYQDEFSTDTALCICVK
jgi:hypothetical protein